MYQYKRNLFITIIICMLFTSCSVFSPVKIEPANQYVINKTPVVKTKKSARRINLLVKAIDASPIYNTEQMAYSTYPYQVAYFAKNRWADKPSRMLQFCAVQTLQNTHYFHSVNSSINGQNDYLLNLQLLQLQQNFSTQASEIHMTVRAQLIDLRGHRVVALKTYSVTKETPYATPYGGVVAANQAAACILSQIAHLCLQKL